MVEFPVIVKFPLTVDEAEEIKPEVNVERPPVESVVPTDRDPVKLAVDEIVCPLIVPVVIAPSVVAPATDNVPLMSVLPVVKFVEKRLVDEAVVANIFVEVAFDVVELSPVKF